MKTSPTEADLDLVEDRLSLATKPHIQRGSELHTAASSDSPDCTNSEQREVRQTSDVNPPVCRCQVEWDGVDEIEMREPEICYR